MAAGLGAWLSVRFFVQKAMQFNSIYRSILRSLSTFNFWERALVPVFGVTKLVLGVRRYARARFSLASVGYILATASAILTVPLFSIRSLESEFDLWTLQSSPQSFCLVDAVLRDGIIVSGKQLFNCFDDTE